MLSTAAFVMLIWTSSGYGDAVHTIPFPTEKACQNAKALIRKEWGRNLKLWMVCIPTEFNNDPRI